MKWSHSNYINSSRKVRVTSMNEVSERYESVECSWWECLLKSLKVGGATSQLDLIRDLGRVSEWCDFWGMKLNARKTKTMIVSRSRTMHPQSPPLTIGGTVLKESDDLAILWVTFDSKMTFEKHLCSVSRAVSQRLGILRKSRRVFHDRWLLGRCFRGFVLPVLEYVLQSGARLPIHTLNYWTVQSVVPGF